MAAAEGLLHRRFAAAETAADGLDLVLALAGLLGNAEHVLRDLGRGGALLREHVREAADALSNLGDLMADAFDDGSDLRDHLAARGNRLEAVLDGFVDFLHLAGQRVDAAANFLGCLAGLDRQRLDLSGDDGEAAAGFTGAGGLDGRVEREQVGLAGDAVDGVRHLADLIDGRLQNGNALADGARALLN